MPPRKKSPAQLDREITSALAVADMQKLVEQWKSAAAFNYSKARDEPEDEEYRKGYAAAMEAAARDLLTVIQRKSK